MNALPQTLYMKAISKLKPLSREEECRLSELIKQGDKKALDTLVKANLLFVVQVAKGYQGQGMLLDDLICEGNTGLIEAAKHFDGNRNFKFISYAVWYIRQRILIALPRQSRAVYLPLNQVKDYEKIFKAQKKLEVNLERMPTVQEIAQETGFKDEDIKVLLYVTAKPVSLNAPLSERGDTSFIDIIQDANIDNSVEDMDDALSNAEEVKIFLDTLKDREKEIVKLSFGIDSGCGLTLQEIADKYGLTRERVRQIKDKAIVKLQKRIRSKQSERTESKRL